VQTSRGSCSIDDDSREMLDLREDLADGVNQTDGKSIVEQKARSLTAALSTMFLTVKCLMACPFQRIRVTWPCPVLLQPPFLLSWSAKAHFSERVVICMGAGWSYVICG